MENLALIESFSEFKDEKFIDRVTLMSILEEVFRNTLKKNRVLPYQDCVRYVCLHACIVPGLLQCRHLVQHGCAKLDQCLCPPKIKWTARPRLR